MQEGSTAKPNMLREYNYQDIVSQNELGEGAQATALLCTFKGNQTRLVVKNFFRWNDEVEAEIRNLIETITGPNVVRLFGVLVNNRRRIGIVMEYCEDGSLDKIVRNPEDHYTYGSIMEWMLQASNGIQFLHEGGIVHRDVKPANMLLSHNRKNLKLSDMSPSIWTGENQYENTFNGRGTPGFRAWEIEDGEDYTSAVDIFSLGRSLWNLLYRQHPTDRGLAVSFCNFLSSLFPMEYAPYIKECLRRASEKSGDRTLEDLYTQYLQSPMEYSNLLKEKLREDNVKYVGLGLRRFGHVDITSFLRIIAKMTAPIREGRLNITDVYTDLSILNEAFEASLKIDLSQIKTMYSVYKKPDLRRLKEVENNAFGDVMLVNVGDDRSPVAYKEYFGTDYLYTCNEVLALSTLSSHVNIVRLLGMTKEGPFVDGLLLEYCEGGSLWHHIREDSYQVIEKDILNWMMQAASALLYAHQNGFVHLDVKPSNMLLCFRKKKLQIYGFEIAEHDVSRSNLYPLDSESGTRGFMAPEIENYNEFFTNAVDVFALGRTIWQLIFKEFPKNHEVELSLHQPFNNQVSTDLFEFMIRMMSPEATDRPTMEEAHNFLGTRLALEEPDG